LKKQSVYRTRRSKETSENLTQLCTKKEQKTNKADETILRENRIPTFPDKGRRGNGKGENVTPKNGKKATPRICRNVQKRREEKRWPKRKSRPIGMSARCGEVWATKTVPQIAQSQERGERDRMEILWGKGNRKKQELFCGYPPG